MFVKYLKAIKLPEIFEEDINNPATIKKSKLTGRFMATVNVQNVSKRFA